MNLQFKGKTALVTGGNKGIGFAICKGLLAAGFDVILAARSLNHGYLASYGSLIKHEWEVFSRSPGNFLLVSRQKFS